MKLDDRERLRQWMAQACVIPMVCLSVTAPPIVFSTSLPYFKVEQLLIPIVVVVYVWLLLAGVARPIRFNGMFLVGLFYCACTTISIAYGATVLGHPLDYRDFYELPKDCLPVAFFTIGYEAELSESSLRRLLTCFSFAALLICLYAWGQFANLGFTYKLNSFYSGGLHIDLALEYARRVYATMGNANVLASLMAWCVVLFTLASVLRAGHRLLFSLTALACLVTLVMTGSRHGIVTIAIGLVLMVASKSLAGRRAIPNLALSLVLIVVVLTTYQAVAGSNVRTLQRYQTLSEPLRIDSLRERLDQLWPPLWAEFTKSPIFGQGPEKSLFWSTAGVPTYLDSEFLGVLKGAGVLGFLVFLGYYLYPLWLIRKGRQAALSFAPCKAAQEPASATILHASFIIGVLALISEVAMGTFWPPLLQGFLWLWLGLGACAALKARQSLLLSRTPLDESTLAVDSRTLFPLDLASRAHH